jgi:hypothetical protein
MSVIRFISRGSCLLSLIALLSGCIIAPDHDYDHGSREGYSNAPHEGYYDREHHRYYHDHSWHDCHEHDRYCH